MGDFQAFPMVCLAALVIYGSSVNWQWVKLGSFLFRSATILSGDIGVSKSVERKGLGDGAVPPNV